MFTKHEPLPVEAAVDLSSLIRSGPVRPSAAPQPLKWASLDDDSFERLLFVLLQRTDGYSDVNWLMRTRASDRGRDIQSYRLLQDPVGPSRRLRVIVQCKHWQSRSVTLGDLSALLAKVSLWEPPKVDEIVVATSGRFTEQAVTWSEAREADRAVPRVVLLAELQIETMLSQHQGLFADFGLR